MRASTAVSALLATVLATTLALGAQAGSETPARSVEKTFLIPSSDGYGVAECLTTGGECGQVVADAWCESQGYAKSASFGVAAQDEYTGAIEAAPAVKTSDRPIRITCRD